MGGFECSSHINQAGHRLDMLAGTQHDVQARGDYDSVAAEGIKTVRDGVRWNLVESTPGIFDFASFAPMLEAAQAAGVQVIWDLCHYGWPADLDLFSEAFPNRFASYAAATAKYVLEHTSEVPFYAPVNEISFFAWAAARWLMYPYAHGRDQEIKKQLVRGVVAAVQAIRAVDPQARFIYPEPIIHVVAPHGRPDMEADAARHGLTQFEAWDMVAGHLNPELGGKPEYLDILGCNFYATNEWVGYDGVRLVWDAVPPDTRWRPLHLLLWDVWQRYRLPMFIAETSHVGDGRGKWIRIVSDEAAHAQALGVELDGICLYPVLDRYDWGNPNHWHNSGLLDVARNDAGKLLRKVNAEYSNDLRLAQKRLVTI